MLDGLFGTDELPNQHVYEVAQMVVKEYMDEHHVKIDHVASLLGTTKGYLYAGLDPSQTTKPLSIDRIIAITKLTGDNSILDAVVKQFDLILVNKIEAQASVLDLNVLVDRASIENNDVFREAKVDLSDGVIDAEEKKRIIKELDEADKANAELRSRVMSIEVD